MQRISIKWTPTACEDTQKFLRKQPEEKKKLKKALRLLSEHGPQYPSLRTHTMSGVKAADDSTIYISYVENRTPTAWRLHWSYWGKSQGFGSEPGGDEIMETKANA